MTSEPTGHGKRPDDGDREAKVETGLPDQRLIIEGWLASHADSGTPGAHLHLRTSDGRDPVLRTSQVPVLIASLSSVADRIDRMWEVDGDEYAQAVVRRSPNPDDPEVIRQRRINELQFTQRLAPHMPQVVTLLRDAESTDEAIIAIAALLGTDEAEVMVRLARFDLLSLTRPATSGRAQMLADLE